MAAGGLGRATSSLCSLRITAICSSGGNPLPSVRPWAASEYTVSRKYSSPPGAVGFDGEPSHSRPIVPERVRGAGRDLQRGGRFDQAFTAGDAHPKLALMKLEPLSCSGMDVLGWSRCLGVRDEVEAEQLSTGVL